MVKQEETFWRDGKISQRHRTWGMNAPAVDIDWLVLEYDDAAPVAMIDWKAYGSPEVNLMSNNLRALRSLANAAGIPLMIVYYQSFDWWFRVIPANVAATRYYPTTMVMSEQEFVGSLYRLRGRVMPKALAHRLGIYKPQEQR